jgi:hypothetical protein
MYALKMVTYPLAVCFAVEELADYNLVENSVENLVLADFY